MKIGFIGLGMVGSAVSNGMAGIGHEVHGYDIKRTETSIHDVLGTEIIFVCVPTPSRADGSCDTSIVEQVVGDLDKAGYRGLVTIKSTVEPGTTDRLSRKYPGLRLAFCPEFLRERTSREDFVSNQYVCIIGTDNEKDYELLRDAHGSLPKNFARMKPTEAELAKYFWNVFNALRVVYANQFYDVAKAAGADYKTIKNALVRHPNISDAYLDCDENFRGFGGNCLPKDTAAFAHFARKTVGGDLSLFEGIVEINKRYKQTVF
ncbi:MAG TPA: hypothetical protein VG753_01010 [Candidatus Paceibacterota bacterium]|nr:hypothetical protein [Candidatus Paceibacterota bacterium]